MNSLFLFYQIFGGFQDAGGGWAFMDGIGCFRACSRKGNNPEKSFEPQRREERQEKKESQPNNHIHHGG
ncbi:MAG TPA: hypothetical protein VFG19_08200 [Geobacteraceae bacterium]|nr:hypothetical protein [Geobacteraceae bacterium]